MHFRPECEASSVIHMLLIFSVPVLCMSDFSASIWGAATWKRTILASAPRLAPALILVWKKSIGSGGVTGGCFVFMCVSVLTN